MSTERNEVALYKFYALKITNVYICLEYVKRMVKTDILLWRRRLSFTVL